jgi:hypothetical protein
VIWALVAYGTRQRHGTSSAPDTRPQIMSGVKRLAVLGPGFAADCLETIEESGQENAATSTQQGGEEFVRIGCLNDSENGMRVIEAIVRRELQGWISRGGHAQAKASTNRSCIDFHERLSAAAL